MWHSRNISVESFTFISFDETAIMGIIGMIYGACGDFREYKGITIHDQTMGYYTQWNHMEG